VNDWPVGFLCSALHSLGHNQHGTGGFRGFVHAENDSMVQLKEYFPGGHSAPLDDQENLETICEYLFTAVPAAMAKAQPKPLSRSERLLNWSSEKAAVIAVAIVASILIGWTSTHLVFYRLMVSRAPRLRDHCAVCILVSQFILMRSLGRTDDK
jgi:hypothetical protein